MTDESHWRCWVAAAISVLMLGVIATSTVLDREQMRQRMAIERLDRHIENVKEAVKALEKKLCVPSPCQP